ncbi:MAG: hypothetical protein PHS57_05995 [Alphaproteobacteria bacterium]|nr:hypothetical protein [Alphaproteobacteria bacterium]
MKDVERAMVFYDGDGSKPFCDLVWQALKEKRDRENGCKCGEAAYAVNKHNFPTAKFCPLCGCQYKE